MQYILLFIVVLSVVMLYLLALATGNASVLTQSFWWILSLNTLLFLVLVVMVVKQVWQLRKNIKNRVFGAKLARKLALMFAAVAILPGVLLFAVSTQFISHSIESWFGDDTELALDRGLRLSKAALELSLDETVRETTLIQTQLASLDNSFFSSEENIIKELSQLREDHKLGLVALYQAGTGKLLAVSYDHAREREKNKPVLSKEIESKLVQEGIIRSTEMAGSRLFSQVWLPVSGEGGGYALYVKKTVPEAVADDALLIEGARSNYTQLKYAKDSMQTFFLLTLLIASLLAITLALACALFLSQRFTAPLFALAAGARAVAQGDFSQRSPVYRQDELGMLSSLFNRMTEQLQEAQAIAESNRKKQEAARAYLESVLASLSAGVIAFSAYGKIKAVNLSAEKILGFSFAPLEDVPWWQWSKYSSKTTAFVEMLKSLMAHEGQGAMQIDYNGPDVPLILLAKATQLPEDMGGTVWVFDDVTELVKAQKDAAWGEVAKRLAHEIRNPLTPIQLSAERLAMKLTDKLSEADAAMLLRATDTIVKQVTALKGMVEAFRNYARVPVINAQTVDLNEIVKEVLILYEESACTIASDLSNIPLYVQADTAMMRQVLHNLLQNAQDAVSDIDHPMISIVTYQENECAVLCVQDNGSGFDQRIMHQAFDPYVTSKKTGTGLGLAVVKKIVDEHRGSITINNAEPTGALIKITLPLLEV